MAGPKLVNHFASESFQVYRRLNQREALAQAGFWLLSWGVRVTGTTPRSGHGSGGP